MLYGLRIHMIVWIVFYGTFVNRTSRLNRTRNRSITTLEVMELTEPSICIADMEPDSGLQATTRMPRTHAQIMSDMGFETPAPVPKRFKSAWDHLVHNFPCPPEIQHRI